MSRHVLTPEYADLTEIYSDSHEEHVRHVRAVLRWLLQHQLYVKAEKCEVHRTNTPFLGYIISQDGVSMDEKKVQAVLDWPQPQTVKELQRFLGFANFYRRFIRNFSSVASPLTAMTKRSASRLMWSPEALRSFQELKARFTSAPILRPPRPRASIHRRGRRFQYRGGSRIVPTPGGTRQTVPLCFLLPQTLTC